MIKCFIRKKSHSIQIQIHPQSNAQIKTHLSFLLPTTAQLPEGFTPAPRVTEADKSGDVQTLNRKLNTRVYLSIKPNEDEGWMLPTASINIDKKETFLEGAKRATLMVAGESLELFCPSNCPMGVSAVEYTEEERKANGESFFGEKTFT